MRKMTKLLREAKKHFQFGYQKISPRRSQEDLDIVAYVLQGPLDVISEKKKYGSTHRKKFAGQKSYVSKKDKK